LENPKGAFGILPDLIFADGGITQLSAIKRAVQLYNLTIPVFGLVKDDKHNTRAVMDENRKEIEISDNIMKFVTNIQNEVHNVAIEYNKKLRQSDMTKSKLDDIKGIGEKKREELLKKFGSIEGIKKANVEEISSIKGINADFARKIKKELD
jgi:excinuclease ABC subunit C